jgi:hypothetical protein
MTHQSIMSAMKARSIVAFGLALAAAQARPLHRYGLVREDPRTVPWMVEVKPATNARPRRLGSVDLSSQLPPVGDQGAQGSCTAWAVGYYQKTHYEWLEYHWNLGQSSHQFSPAFIYNQANGGDDQGVSFGRAFALVAEQGCATLADCPYSVNDYVTWPSESAYARAIAHRGASSHWFAMHDTVGINSVRQRLDSGLTTVIGISIYLNFEHIDSFNYTYCVADTYGGSQGAHALTIVGYNDTMTTHDGPGAFKLVNSWGTGWGLSGFCWMSYVAACNGRLSDQTGYYLDDLVGYAPTMFGRVRITHAARDRIGIRLGVGSSGSPLWSRNFRAWRFARIDRPFPDHNLVFDMTEGEPYVTGGETDSVFVRVIDERQDAKAGTLDYFAGEHLVWNTTGISGDTPESIPDYNVAVVARATIPQPNDVGVVALLAPVDTVDSGASVDPRARVKNFGTDPATFPVVFRIGACADTQFVNGLGGNEEAIVSFAAWTALQRGANVTRCSTALANDSHHSNDTLSGTVVVRVRDVACVGILAPRDTVEFGTAVTPRAVVANPGTSTETLDAEFVIGEDYADTVTVTIGPGGSQMIDFTNWKPGAAGTFATRCATLLATDMYPANDTVRDSVVVDGTVGVAELSQLPRVLSLERPAPDPMRGSATARLEVPRVTRAGLSVCSANGALVRVLVGPRPMGPGVYRITWDGRDEQGRRAASGIYFWRLAAGATVITRKAVKPD